MGDGSVRTAWRDLRARWRHALAFHLLMQVLGVALFAPLAGRITNRIVFTSGDRVISNFDIASFVLSPVGLVLLLVVAALTIGLLFAELAGQTWIAAAMLAHRSVRPTAVAATVLRRLPRILWLATLVFLRLALLALPVVAVVGLYWFAILAGHDVNYYLAENPPEWRRAKLLVLLLGIAYAMVAAWQLARWLYSIPVAMLEDRPARTALAESARLAHGQVLKVAAPVVAWWLVLTVAYVVLASAGRALAAAGLDWAGVDLRRVLPMMACVLAVAAIGAFLYGGLGLAGQQFILTRMYAARPSARGEVQPGTSSDATRQQVRIGRAIVVATLGLAALTVAGAWLLVTRLNLKGDVAITAHRGASLEAPENTLAAFRLAMQAGATYAELDVQHSKDGQLVVLHDGDLMRLGGDPRRIGELTMADLATIDVGRRRGPQFAGEHVPTLEQVIDLVRGRMKLNIELKYNVKDPQLAPDVVALLRRLHFGDQVVITSLDYGALKEVKRIAPELRVGHIVTAAVGDVTRTDADFLSLNSARATRAVVRRAHARGKDVAVWTVNKPEVMLRMIEVGVDNVITDDPALLVRVMQQRNALSVPEMLALRLRVLFGQAPAELTRESTVTPL